MDINKIDAFIFDFDGVLTDNKVLVNENGMEWVSCSRADGLAFDVLRKLNKPSYILSTEKNMVVSARAEKLKIPVIQGADNKVESIKELVIRNNFELSNILYVGNDLNDYSVMELCKYTACPADSHKKIKSISTVVLKSKGGNGVVRELLEVFFKLDFIKILGS